jgi:hypothetical protein
MPTRPILDLRRAAVLLGAAAALLGPLRAQDTAPTTRGAPRSRPTDAARSRPAETRPSDEIDAALKDLARAATPGEAAIRAAALYARGESARTRMLEFLRTREATDAVFEGAVTAFEVEGDASVVSVLFDAYGRGSAARDQFASFVFKKFDRRDSLLEPALRSFEEAADPESRRRYLRILAEIVDDPGERLRTAQRLTEDLQKPRDGLAAGELRAALAQITFHEFPDAAAWKDWFERFLAANPSGFTESALYRSSLRQKDQRFLQEVQRNIDTSVAEKRPPLRYLDRRAYPEAVVRRYAARLCGELRGAEAEIVKKAAEALLNLLAEETDDEATAEALAAAGELAGRDPEMGPRVAAAARARLGADSPAVVGSALRALGRTGGSADLSTVEALYDALAKKEDMREARVQLVSTLYALNGGYVAMTRALGDPASTVRAAAARVLSFAKKTTAAPQIAAALARETAAEPQLAMVKALATLDTWEAAAVSALERIVGDAGGLVRDQAVRALLQALASPAFPVAEAEPALRLLAAVAPAAHQDKEKRAALLAELKSVDAHIEFLVRWLSGEGDLAAARDVAQRLAKIAADKPDRLAAAAADLRAAGRREACPILLRAVYAATAAGGSSAASRRTRPDEAAAALVEALTEENTPAALEEALALVDRLLEQRPTDSRLLLLRGGVREARGEAAPAAADLLAVWKAEGVAEGDARRELERRILGALVDSGAAAEALAFLQALPAGNRNREFLIAAARVEAAAGKRKEAARRLRNAVKADGRIPAAAAEFELARLLAQSPSAAERLEAGRIFDAFESAPGRLPEGYPLLELRVPVEADRAAKAAVSALDASEDAATRAERLAALAKTGATAAPWVVEGLDALAQAGSDAAFRARLALLRTWFSADADLAAIDDPAADAPREKLVAAARAILSWWEKRAA